MRTWYKHIADKAGAVRLLLLSTAVAVWLPVTGQAAAPVVAALGSASGSFQSPARVATDAAGNLYVSDPVGGKVCVLDAFGRESYVLMGLGQPLGLAVDSAGRIYVGDAQAGAVSVYDAQGNLLYQLGQGAGEFQLPGHIAVATADGVTTAFVSDGLGHAVKAYRDGVLVGQFGSSIIGPGYFDFPAGICVGPDGNLYVVDQNLDRVQVLDQTGNFLNWFTLQFVPGHFGHSGRSQGIISDAQGRLYVADAFQGRISMFERSGTFLGTIGGYGNGVGQFRLPGGLTLDGQGRLWVANTGNARLEEFGLDCFAQPTISPVARAVSVGATVTFAVNVGCAGGVTYQWLKDSVPLTNGGIISGATNATLTLTGVTVNQSGKYAVVVTGASGSVTTGSSQLTVTAAPVITSQPSSRPAGRGTTATFSVVASGSGLTYRWFYNGLELAAPNSSTLVLTNVQGAMAGSYYVVVTNTAGTATSTQVALTVVVAPAIITAPSNQTVPERGTATFSVVATGVLPLTYQWYRGGVAMSGQTGTTLTMTNVSPASNNTYYVRVANTSGATNSTSATLTVTPDTVPPMALSAAGGAATNRTILVSFSDAVGVTSAQQTANYQLTGPGGLSVVSAVVTNTSRVLLTLSGERLAGADYSLQVRNVTDTAYTPNTLSPNPTTLSVLVADSLGTVAWWPLNEGAGTVARDAAGYGYDGTLESAAWTTGPTGSAVSLNGTSGDVAVPALNVNTNTLTISAWVRRSGAQSNLAGILFTRAASSVAGLQFGHANDLRYNWNGLATATNFSSGLVVPDGVWTFVALVVAPEMAILYLNTGSGFVSATNLTAHAVEEFNGASYLGWDSAASTRRFNGAMDDVRVCSRALSAAELQALYTATATPPACLISAPANGAVFNTPSATLLASVTPNGNSIDKVEFWSGSTLVGTVHSAPYGLVWNNLTSGVYGVQARAWYGPGNYSVNSPTVSFSVSIPIVTTLTLTNGTLTLRWSGALPPYQVQVATNAAAPNWSNVGAATASTSMTLLPTNAAAFYRVTGY